MDPLELVKQLTPETVENLKTAVETGKWSDGTALTEQQLESSIQAIMLYDSQHNTQNDEPFRVKPDGNVVLGKPEATKQFNQTIIKTRPVDDDN